VATAMTRALSPIQLETLRDLSRALIAASQPAHTDHQSFQERDLT
jgi:hypothetical protein